MGGEIYTSVQRQSRESSTFSLANKQDQRVPQTENNQLLSESS